MIYLLDLRKIPADSDSFSERPISLSFVGVSTGTPPEDKLLSASLKPNPFLEVLVKIWHRAIFPGVDPKYCNRNEA